MIDQLKTDASSGDRQSQSTVYQLARTMVGDENFKVSPAVCTRVAIMVCRYSSTSQHYLSSPQRQVYTKFPNSKFWDEVDKFLDSTKPMSEERKFKYVIPTRFDYTYLFPI